MLLPTRDCSGPRALGRGRRVRAHGNALGCGGTTPGLLDLAQLADLGGEGQFQRLGQILQQVEAIRDLHRPGCAAASVSASRSALRQAQEQRHRAAMFQVHQHRAIGEPPAHYPVVHPEGGRRHDGRCRRPPDQVQQCCIAARRQPEPCARRTAKREGCGREPIRQPSRPARPGTAMPGRRSAKVRRSHRALSQKSRRTLSRMATRCSPQGRSASLRSYRLWVRLACQPHNGHGIGREREARVRVIVGGAGARLQVSSRIEAGPGNKRESRFTYWI